MTATAEEEAATAERARYDEERARVVEEWSDIELRYKDGPPNLERLESVDGENVRLDSNANGLGNGNHSVDFKEEEILRNELWRRIFETNYDTAKLEARKHLQDIPPEALGVSPRLASFTSYPFSGLSRLRCVCRPQSDAVEIVKNERLKDQRLLLVALANTPFSAASIEHWRMLCDFFRRAATAAIGDTAQAAHCPRTGQHWQIVGFQGMDPSTDLRGVGLLGLLQLHYLVSEWGMPEDQIATILKFSRDDKQNFPFAVVGLNFTSLIVTRLKNGELNGLANMQNSFLDVVNGLYRGCFIVFYRDWKTTGKTIIDFQFALQNIERIMKRDPSALLRMKWVDEVAVQKA